VRKAIVWWLLYVLQSVKIASVREPKLDRAIRCASVLIMTPLPRHQPELRARTDKIRLLSSLAFRVSVAISQICPDELEVSFLSSALDPDYSSKLFDNSHRRTCLRFRVHPSEACAAPNVVPKPVSLQDSPRPREPEKRHRYFESEYRCLFSGRAPQARRGATCVHGAWPGAFVNWMNPFWASERKETTSLGWGGVLHSKSQPATANC